MRRKEKLIAILAAVLGASIFLAWLGVELRARIIEERALKNLQSWSTEEREEAALALGEMASVRSVPAILGVIAAVKQGPDSGSVNRFGRFEQVTEALREAHSLEEASVRRIIARKGVAVVPVLVRLLEENGASVEQEAGEHVEQVRKDAIKWLAEIGPDARAAVPALLVAFKKSPPAMIAAEALIEIGRPGDELLPDLIDSLRSDADEAAVKAIRLMGKRGKDAIPAMLRCLEVGSHKEIAALLALQGVDAVIPLCDALHGDEKDVLEHVVEMKSSDTVPALIAILENPDASSEWDFAFRTLERIGPQALQAVPALLRRAREGEEQEGEFRHNALLALGSIGAASPDVMSLLQEALHEEAEIARAAAAKALARLGPAAAVARPRLEEIAREDADLHACSWAGCALARIDRSRIPDVIARMIELMTGKTKTEENKIYFSDPFLDVTPQDIAADVLAELGPAAKDAAMPTLIDLCRRALEKNDGMALKPILRAMSKIGTDAEALLPFTDALRHPSPERRSLALGALYELGPAAEPAIPALKAALQDENLESRVRAAVVLGKLDPSIREAIPVLREALGARERRWRDVARQYLERSFGESP